MKKSAATPQYASRRSEKYRSGAYVTTRIGISMTMRMFQGRVRNSSTTNKQNEENDLCLAMVKVSSSLSSPSTEAAKSSASPLESLLGRCLGAANDMAWTKKSRTKWLAAIRSVHAAIRSVHVEYFFPIKSVSDESAFNRHQQYIGTRNPTERKSREKKIGDTVVCNS